MKTSLANVRKPMVPMNGMTGVLEKRLLGTSSLALDHAVALAGSIYDRETDDTLLLADATDWHNNHGEDEAPNTMNLSDAAAFNMEWARGVESPLGLADSVHISLDGYPHGIDRSKYEIITDSDAVIGQAVYISSSDHVDLASCDPGTASPEVIGLVLVGGLTGEYVSVLTEGSVEQSDWTAVTGSTLLTPGAIYFLGATAGSLTTTAPTTDTYVVTRVGRAITTMKMDLEIGEVVEL